MTKKKYSIVKVNLFELLLIHIEYLSAIIFLLLCILLNFYMISLYEKKSIIIDTFNLTEKWIFITEKYNYSNIITLYLIMYLYYKFGKPDISEPNISISLIILNFISKTIIYYFYGIEYYKIVKSISTDDKYIYTFTVISEWINILIGIIFIISICLAIMSFLFVVISETIIFILMNINFTYHVKKDYCDNEKIDV